MRQRGASYKLGSLQSTPTSGSMLVHSRKDMFVRSTSCQLVCSFLLPRQEGKARVRSHPLLPHPLASICTSSCMTTPHLHTQTVHQHRRSNTLNLTVQANTMAPKKPNTAAAAKAKPVKGAHSKVDKAWTYKKYQNGLLNLKAPARYMSM